MKCKLDPNLNQCRFFDSQIECCNNDSSCSFQYEEAQTAPYIRGERWHEKYTDPVKRAKHRRIWQCYFRTDDETDGPIRRALTEIEDLPDLPVNFEIVDIKYKFEWGIRMDFRNAGNCRQRIQEILRRLGEETRYALDKDDIIEGMNTPIEECLPESEMNWDVEQPDPFYSKENMAELERRVADIRSGKSVLKEHELIDIDQEK